MKLFSIMLLAGTCTQIIDVPGCGSREVKYPCPDPSPEVSPSPSPIASPSPSPEISPSSDPIPSPSPQTSPSPSPIIPSPSPSPLPSPSPDNDLTESGNYKLPDGWETGKTCNANYAKGKPSSYGAAYLSTVPIKPGNIYLGIRINASVTPHIGKPYCEHSCYDEEGNYALSNCRNNCEQLKGCQDPNGAPIYITLPGHFTNDICDEQSHNKWNCHHKPKKNETGPTTFIAYPTGMTPDSAKAFCGTPHPKKPGFVNCYGITVDVK